MGSGLLQKEAARKQEYASRGVLFGEQKTLDLMEIALHRRGWGYKRIRELLDDLQELDFYYYPAFIRGPEQDVYQERLDREIADIVKDNAVLIPFRKRYPDVASLGYKPMRGVTPIEYKEGTP